jgi:hypothetical protein
MNKLLASAAIAVLLGFTPALAADNTNMAESTGTQSGTNALPTQPGVSPEAAKSANEPESGGADTSRGAKEQSSAPVGSGAASGYKTEHDALSGGAMDTSKGAKEQSSAPPGSSAAETGKPNPSLGGESSKE